MTLLVYAGNAGDRNERGVRGAERLGRHVAEEFDTTAEFVGTSMPVIDGGWSPQLQAASPGLKGLAHRFDALLCAGQSPVTFMSRCAASLGTLPVLARHAPDAVVVWFDAHGDCNVPIAGEAGRMAYLGGMVLTGAAGEWDTGLGSGLDLANVILVGARDLDPPEMERVATGQVRLVAGGPDLGTRLADAIGGRRVYIHLDCDVLDAGLTATEYQSTGGLSFEDLNAAFTVLARHDLLGLEITEYEDAWPNGTASDPEPIVSAISPVLKALARRE